MTYWIPNGTCPKCGMPLFGSLVAHAVKMHPSNWKEIVQEIVPLSDTYFKDKK